MVRKLYLLGAIVGIIVPYYFFIQFLLLYGLDFGSLFELLFANPISIFFAADVIISALVLLVFIFSEGRRLEMTHLWVYVVCTFLVGVSLALPLFLYVREVKLAQTSTG